MDSPPKLSGETLVVHHIPLVHCQVSGGWKGGCGSSLKRSTPFSSPENLGLSRTTSLPERDVLQREALLYSSLIQTSSGSLSSHNRGREKKGSERGGSTASDDSSFASSNSEDQLTTAHTLPRTKPRRRNPLRHNPFLLNTENNDEDDEEEDGDNLSGYLEDSSFHLHSDTNSVLDDRMVPFHLHSGFASEPFILHSSVRRGSRESLRGPTSDLSNHLDDLDMLGLDSQCRHGSSGSNMSMDCGEQDWGDDDEEDQPMKCGRNSKTGSYSSSSSIQHCSCCGLSQSYPQHFPEAFPEPFLEFQQGYGSDSSCNSSDGVLVNFSAIYNKMNNSIPEKQPAPGPTNLNSSTDHSSISYISDNPGHKDDSAGGAFYLDIQTSPTEPPRSQQQPSCLSNNFPLILEPHLTTSSTCSCSAEHQGTFGLDANCNSFHPPHEGSSGDLASCLQSQARLVVATQNYYKLVTCDLSSQSSPSPVGSSVNSCSDEHSKGSPTPSQPSEYFLFRQQDDEMGLKEELEQEGEVGESSRQDDDDNKEDKEGKKSNQEAIGGAETAPAMIEGQVYVNVSPPLAGKGVIGDGASSGSRPRSRSYDRNLDKSPSPRLGSLERMLSCPVRLSEGAAQVPTPPPRVTSFAEIARSKRRIGATGGSPLQKSAADPFSSTYSTHSHSSVDFSPIPEQCVEVVSPAMSPIPFTRCYSQGDIERQLEGARETQDTWEKAEGGLSSSSDSRPAVVRYSKDQRPTTLPIQPFTFQHQFTSRPAQAKPLLPLLTGYHSGMQVHTSSSSGGPFGDDTAGNGHNNQGSLSTAAPPMELVRPSPLGSYSPVHFQGAHSSETCTPNPQCTHRPSCPLSAGLDPLHTPLTGKKGGGSAPLTQTPPSLGVKRGVVPPMLPTVQGQCLHHGPLYSLPALHSDSLSPLGLDSGKTPEGGKGSGARTQNAHHLSPQALKWREYRRRNPLGGERVSGGHSSAGSGPVSGNTELRRSKGARPTRRNVFDFPAAHSSHMMGHLTGGQSAKLQQSCSDFLHDYFSMTEKPPEEFCLSPDASSSSSCSPSQPQVSVDLMQKRGLVKAVNTAVDLIVAHFGTSRVPNVKAKLGNSWVSPNVGHLILKYLCPALHDVLQDGLKAFVLDLIIGQRRCLPWNLVEASTQLGPSTRHLHSLFSKVSQYSELTSHSMRLNAFIFGLLNLKSLEFWFNHLYTHEDIVAAHYSPWGFLPLSHGACQTLFEELLLLLQPLSLLPFDLDLLFEPHLLQKGEEHLRHKEQLCSAGQSVDQASRSTFQLMRGWSTTVSGMVRDSRVEAKRERAGLRREGTWPRMEGSGSRNEAAGVKLRVKVTPVSRSAAMENGSPSLWRGRESESQRIKGVGQESNGDNEGVKEKDSRMGKEREPACEGRQHQDRQAGWWYQLMQSSQVYIDQSTEGSKFVKTEKRKRSSERRQGQAPPAREGVVEGAESRHEGEGEKSSTSGGDSAGCGGRPSWMGSPPQSVLNQEKDTNPLEVSEMAAQAAVQEESPPQGQSLRWGRLFGSSVGIPLRVEGAEQKPKSQKTRPPSGWLGLDKSVLELMALTIGGGGKKTERPDTPTHTQTTTDPVSSHQAETQQSVCEVRALCHHIATEPDQLSFNKGDILQVLRKADPDWLLCSLGSTRGLVPIVYVTLNSMEDSQDATGLMQL